MMPGIPMRGPAKGKRDTLGFTGLGKRDTLGFVGHGMSLFSFHAPLHS